MSNVQQCKLCIALPVGLEGHERLIATTTGPSHRVVFKCSACGSRWAREYEGSGRFLWVDLTHTKDR